MTTMKINEPSNQDVGTTKPNIFQQQREIGHRQFLAVYDVSG